jgi:hypothetical protein
MPDPRVPGAWADEPVTPALLRWRVTTSGSTSAWHTAIDFRVRYLFEAGFPSVYTTRTRQNHEGQPGQYCFYLQRSSALGASATVQVEVSDTAGNAAIFSAPVGRPGLPL